MTIPTQFVLIAVLFLRATRGGSFFEDCNFDWVPDECEWGTPPLFVIVLEEPAQPLTFRLRPGFAHRVDYDPARLRVWDSPTRDNLIPSGHVSKVPFAEAVPAGGTGMFGIALGVS